MTSSLHDGASAVARSDPKTSVTIAATRDEVFDVLLDPRTYPEWLLGAQKIRKVDGNWPAPASAFHHTVGVGPIRISDHTKVVTVDRPDQLILSAHIGPVGSARVTFTLKEIAATSEAGRAETEVEMVEVPESGPLKVLWWSIGRWLVAFSIWGRNELTLDNLKSYVEGRAATT